MGSFNSSAITHIVSQDIMTTWVKGSIRDDLIQQASRDLIDLVLTEYITQSLQPISGRDMATITCQCGTCVKVNEGEVGLALRWGALTCAHQLEPLPSQEVRGGAQQQA